jgi:TRAP-type C4-dicarboxylate transport system substrate-binding protein
MTIKKPINSLEDVKGMKLHINGKWKVESGKALGIVPISMPYGDVYTAATKGVIEGGVWPWELLKSRRYWDFVKFVVNINISRTAFFLVMNLSKWEKLPNDIKRIFEETTGEVFSRKAALSMAGFAEKAEAEKKGVSFKSLHKSELEKWETHAKGVIDKWVEEMEKKKLPGKDVFNMRVLLEKESTKPTKK